MNQSSQSAPLPPGSLLGVLGSGQLGRMFAQSAAKLGYRVATYSPEAESPTAQVCDREFVGGYDDLAKLRDFAGQVSALTFEFENVPSATVQAIADIVPVRPAGSVLHICQHRLREKEFLNNAGFPVAPFRAVNSLDELRAAVSEIGLPAILKTAGFGYDGKGQFRIREESQITEAWNSSPIQQRVLEGWVNFSSEISVIVARDQSGECEAWAPFENVHENGILDLTVSPPRVSDAVQESARDLARRIAEKLKVVGLLCIEMFVTKENELIVNELAPRPHNSGHLTIEAAECSQFEQLARIVAGLPLGSSALVKPAAMVNLLGDLWNDGEPNWSAALKVPGVHLHLYGKREAVPGRKMGHITVLADSIDEASQKAIEARRRLGNR